jgi:hypothetical protein
MKKSQTDQIDQIDQTHQTNEMNQTDQIDSITRLASLVRPAHLAVADAIDGTVSSQLFRSNLERSEPQPEP